mmetsp:Transcript_39773/g.124235  ORF Transcript_39773/g.124235 Transcript_39773/m.124235 type:complete len:371 (+) Transcript_39773:210-1322(+)
MARRGALRGSRGGAASVPRLEPVAAAAAEPGARAAGLWRRELGPRRGPALPGRKLYPGAPGRRPRGAQSPRPARRYGLDRLGLTGRAAGRLRRPRRRPLRDPQRRRRRLLAGCGARDRGRVGGGPRRGGGDLRRAAALPGPERQPGPHPGGAQPLPPARRRRHAQARRGATRRGLGLRPHQAARGAHEAGARHAGERLPRPRAHLLAGHAHGDLVGQRRHGAAAAAAGGVGRRGGVCARGPLRLADAGGALGAPQHRVLPRIVLPISAGELRADGARAEAAQQPEPEPQAQPAARQRLGGGGSDQERAQPRRRILLGLARAAAHAVEVPRRRLRAQRHARGRAAAVRDANGVGVLHAAARARHREPTPRP